MKQFILIVLPLLQNNKLVLHDAAATALAVALGNGLPMEDAGLLAAAACDCILTAEASHEFVDIDTLGTWLDEMVWQMQISER